MFTGLIEHQGIIHANIKQDGSNRLVIDCALSNLVIGESIAINGVCLTLVPSVQNMLEFDVSPETLHLTNLGGCREGEVVNIERAMLATARLGGHYVSGHIDTTVPLKKITPLGDFIEMTFGEFDIAQMKFLLPKGSISLDGVSLTINEVTERCIKVLLVPHTLENTNFADRKVDEAVNVEFDYLTRIIAHQLSHFISVNKMN